jgi:hypothetical protein
MAHDRGRSFLDAKTRICEIMLRCDGRKLAPGRTMCRPCEDAMKPKTNPPLRGERHLDYEESRNNVHRRLGSD